MRTPSFVRAALLAALLVTPGVPLREAHAVDIGTIATALQTAYSLYQKYLSGDLTLEQATRQVIDAIAAARTDILAHIDRIAAADGRACSRTTLTLFPDIERMSPDTQMALANNAVACLSLIESYLQVVDDPTAVDSLGYALSALGPVVVLARAHVGYQPGPDVPSMLVSGNLAVIQKLRPHCFSYSLPGDSDGRYVELNIICTAYNGDTGFESTYVGDPHTADLTRQAEDDATYNTSRTLAQRTLPSIPPAALR